MAATTPPRPMPRGWSSPEAAAVAMASWDRLKAARRRVVSPRSSQSVREPNPTIAAATGGLNRYAIARFTGPLIVTSTLSVTGAGRRLDAAQAISQKRTAPGPTPWGQWVHRPVAIPERISAPAPRMTVYRYRVEERFSAIVCPGSSPGAQSRPQSLPLAVCARAGEARGPPTPTSGPQEIPRLGLGSSLARGIELSPPTLMICHGKHRGLPASNRPRRQELREVKFHGCNGEADCSEGHRSCHDRRPVHGGGRQLQRQVATRTTDSDDKQASGSGGVARAWCEICRRSMAVTPRLLRELTADPPASLRRALPLGSEERRVGK